MLISSVSLPLRQFRIEHLNLGPGVTPEPESSRSQRITDQLWTRGIKIQVSRFYDSRVKWNQVSRSLNDFGVNSEILESFVNSVFEVSKSTINRVFRQLKSKSQESLGLSHKLKAGQ